MKIYDYVVIGSGIAGCSVAHFLTKYDKRVAILDKEGLGAGGSGAAGAFLSPLPGKINPYNTLVNEALEYSLKFYENLVPDTIVKNGLFRLPNKNFHEDKEEDSKKILYNNLSGYFYENAAIVEPSATLKKLTQQCDFYIKDVKKLIFDDSLYLFNEFAAKHIILAQGVIEPLLDIPYIKIEPIFGTKIDIKTSTILPFNLHKDISISTNKQDGSISIGATKQRHNMAQIKCISSCDKCEFYINTGEAQVEELLTKAKELVELENLEILKIYKGARATIKSYFPVIGEVIEYKTTMQKHPSIKNGTKIPPNLLSYQPNIHIINALGSRGFVLAPYLADILTSHIINNKDIPKHISTHKLFYKYARS